MHAASAEQENVCDLVLQGQNVVTTAVAGAGKSTASFHVAERLALTRSNQKTLVLCFNNALAAASVDKARAAGVHEYTDCMTVHALASLIFGRAVHDPLTLLSLLNAYDSAGHVAPSVPGFDYALVVIDEAQDLDVQMVRVVRVFCDLNKNKNVQWLVIGDSAQEIYAFTGSTCDLLGDPQKYLPCSPRIWSRAELNRSYRLTAPVCNMLNHIFNTHIVPGNTHNKQMMPEFVVGNMYDGHLRLVVLQLLKEYGVNNMMILAPSVDTPACEKLCLQLAADHRVPVYMSSQRGDKITHNKLVVSSFHQSKGLERDCVVVMGAGGFYESRFQAQRNPLHVALTRARERLVIFHHHMEHRLTPFKDQDLVAEVFKVQLMTYEPVRRIPYPDRVPPKEFEGATLTKFVPDECVARLTQAIRVSKPKSIGPPLVGSTTFVVENESTKEFYQPALIGALQQHMGADEVTLLKMLHKSSRQFHLLPAYCQAIVKQPQLRPKNAKEWLCIAMVVHAVKCRLMHMPHQIKSMDWVGDAENAFFFKCMTNLVKVFAQLKGTVQFDVPAPRAVTIEPNGASVQVNVCVPVLVTQLTTEMTVQPWLISLDAHVTEDHMWHALLVMWACCVESVRVFLVHSNEIVLIVGGPDVDALVTRLVQLKLASYAAL